MLYIIYIWAWHAPHIWFVNSASVITLPQHGQRSIWLQYFAKAFVLAVFLLLSAMNLAIIPVMAPDAVRITMRQSGGANIVSVMDMIADITVDIF